jgi:single-strand DNA-binding protein
MLNKVTLIGRLGKDPELRYSSSGTPMTNLRIATDESYADREGNKVDRTEWHSVVVFKRQAENCANYLRKGSLVFVEGSLQTRKWQDQQGQARYITEVKAQRIQFLDRRGASEAGGDVGDNDYPAPGAVNRGGKQQPHKTNEGIDPFRQEASLMDETPWDKPSSQRQQPPKSGGDDDLPF